MGVAIRKRLTRPSLPWHQQDCISIDECQPGRPGLSLKGGLACQVTAARRLQAV